MHNQYQYCYRYLNESVSRFQKARIRLCILKIFPSGGQICKRRQKRLYEDITCLIYVEIAQQLTCLVDLSLRTCSAAIFFLLFVCLVTYIISVRLRFVFEMQLKQYLCDCFFFFPSFTFMYYPGLYLLFVYFCFTLPL